MNEHIETIVYLGPSLPILEAKEILPSARFLPPIKCGDMLHALRLYPKNIVIIDGNFEHTAAVWHKEIMLALEQGIHVFGASSMGALRASELANYGMQGIGEIYKNYKNGIYKDDDEVAVLHQPEKYGYKSLSVPMVNLRFTIEKALQDKIIDENFTKEFLQTAKELFYPYRTYEAILNSFKNINGAEKSSLKRWLAQNEINQKKIDAIECLNFVKKNTFISSKITINHTSQLNALRTKCSCAAYPVFRDWLPNQEKIVQISRVFGNEYVLSKIIANLAKLVYGLPDKDDQRQNKKNTLYKNLISSNKDNPLIKQELKKRFYKICSFYKEHEFDKKTSVAVNSLRMVFYPAHEPLDDGQCFLLFFLSYLINVILNYCSSINLIIKEKSLFTCCKNFFMARNINTVEEIVKELSKFDINPTDLKYVNQLLFIIDHFAIKCNHHLLVNNKGDINVFWLKDILILFGLYHKTENLINDPKCLSQKINHFKEKYLDKNKQHFLMLCDFQGTAGAMDFFELIGARYVISLKQEIT